MAHTLSVLTLQLAQAIGLYWLAAGIGLLLAPTRLAAIIADIERSPGLAMIVGLGTFAIGVAILIPHHILYDPLSVVVTSLALVFAIEGLVLLAVPQILVALARPFVAQARLWAIVSIVLGAVMLLAGATGRADALP